MLSSQLQAASCLSLLLQLVPDLRILLVDVSLEGVDGLLKPLVHSFRLIATIGGTEDPLSRTLVHEAEVATGEYKSQWGQWAAPGQRAV